MPCFDTPEPIAVQVEIGVGDIQIVAGQRDDTVVEIRPSRDDNRNDVAAAEKTRVAYAGGRLLVKGPKNWRGLGPFGDSGSVDVTIEVPAGSQVTADAAMGPVRTLGPLGDCKVGTGMGDIALDEGATIQLRSGMGDISVERALGSSEIKTGSGTVRIAHAD